MTAAAVAVAAKKASSRRPSAGAFAAAPWQPAAAAAPAAVARGLAPVGEAARPAARPTGFVAGLCAGVGAAVMAGATALRATATAYSSKTVADLKALLKEKGLPVGGTKAELVSRLEEADGKATPKKSGGRKVAVKAEAAKETKAKAKESSSESSGDPKALRAEAMAAKLAKAREGYDGPPSPYSDDIPDPNEGKPEVIEDEDGRTRYLCLDGQYRRGDPDAIELKKENFMTWLSEWTVAARTGQLEGKPQKTFLMRDPDAPGNPKGKDKEAGPPVRSEDVLVAVEPAEDGSPRWEYVP